MKIPTTIEYCPHCETEVEIKADVTPLPKCPNCDKKIVPCSACHTSKTDCKGCRTGSKFILHHDISN